MKVIKLPVYGIEVNLGNGWGTITSNLKEGADPRGKAAADAIESIILAHACAGIDIESPAYFEGIETAIDAVVNNADELE